MTLAQSLRTKLAARAYPEKARGMQAYLKSGMPYYCVNLPELRAICKVVFAEYPLKSRQCTPQSRSSGGRQSFAKIV